MKHLVSKFK